MAMFEDETSVAWAAMPREAPVVGVDRSEIGVAERWLGDLEDHVLTVLTAAEAATLPGYR